VNKGTVNVDVVVTFVDIIFNEDIDGGTDDVTDAFNDEFVLIVDESETLCLSS